MWWVGRVEGMQELQDRAVSAAETGSPEDLLRVRKEIVHLHGEMVLLENYSALNYTGEHALPCSMLQLGVCVCFRSAVG